MNAFERYAEAARKAKSHRWKIHYWKEALKFLNGEPPKKIAKDLYNAAILARKEIENAKKKGGVFRVPGFTF